jgi:uncharacterized 2Fe-2S/4Fe-4S cluster protein (DUF4445 family)
LSFEVEFEPIGRRVRSEKGTVLNSTQHGGIVLNATCGGDGICGRCLVRVLSGKVSKITHIEELKISSEELADGWRLACQTEILSDLRIYVPPGTLATAQRTQTEGQYLPVKLNPVVKSYEVILDRPTLKDLRSDGERVRSALGFSNLVFHHEVLKTFSDDIRTFDFKISVFINGSTIIAIRPKGTQALGMAVDLGTTKLAGYLIDLASGETLATSGVMNPQIAFGEDVMSRIGHTMHAEDGQKQLQKVIIEELNNLAQDLCSKAGANIRDISDAVIVGNTAMHHLFLGLPVKQLGLAPYVAAEDKALEIDAIDLGLEFSPGAKVYTMPNIAGFVGADHVAMLLGSGMDDIQGNVLGLDIGTNTEISLIVGEKHYACSTASGPAFEGAHIKDGMRAAPGAIEKVLIHDDEIMLQTIGEQSPLGICGSGILDVVAQLRKNEIITKRGSFRNDNTVNLKSLPHSVEFVLVPESENNRHKITFNRSDINQIQLVKGAMRTGIDILLEKAGLPAMDLDYIIIAGAFGTYLDIESGIEIGMFPDLPRYKFLQVGNAAGSGARMCLLSIEKRDLAAKIAKVVEYVELTVEPSFSKVFARNLQLDKS